MKKEKKTKYIKKVIDNKFYCAILYSTEGYTVSSSGADCKSAVLDSGSATLSPSTKGGLVQWLECRTPNPMMVVRVNQPLPEI